MDIENKAKLGYELTDYGKLLFEYNSNQKSNVYYVSAEKRKANYKSPFFYYILAIPLVMIAWLIASIILVFKLEGDERWLRLGLALGSLIPVAFCSFFAIMLAFGFWGKLYEWRIRRAYNKKEEYLRIYQDYIVINKNKKTTVFINSQIKSVELKWNTYIRFVTTNASEIFFMEIPRNMAMARKLEKVFPDKVTIAKPTRYVEPLRYKPLGEVIGAMAFALISMGVGIGLICMRKYANIDVPYFLGAMFIGGGMLLICGAFSFVPFIKDIVLPFVAAGMFVVIPWWLAATLHEVIGLATGIKAFTYLTPFTCVAVLLSSLGALFVVSGVTAIMDYINYGHKLGKGRR